MLNSGALAGSRRLALRAGLTSFPDAIFDLADSLEILDLSGNALSTLPDQLPRLTRLRVLFCSDNAFTTLPDVLGRCPHLTMIGFKANRIDTVPAAALPPGLHWLILTDNQITSLPAALGDCAALQKLMLAGNRLTALPDSLARCTQLELVRLSANALTALPDWLLTMPRLAWLACGGNPFNAEREQRTLADPATGSTAWSALSTHERLGEGASGVIYRATHGARPAAVKLFKGAVTSDGWPHSEMAACIAAGAQPNLIPILSQVHDHPDGRTGLLMPLIDPAYRNLAGPPSMDSCTRDVYADGLTLTLDAVRGIAGGIAAAARHLHRHGILHGDLYGHNILHDGAGHALLGDFGAASLLPAGAPYAAALERIEVRAFGVLLEELLERCDEASPATTRLRVLAHACLTVVPAQRPNFDHIVASLAN